jgi:hypothetical protein
MHATFIFQLKFKLFIYSGKNGIGSLKTGKFQFFMTKKTFARLKTIFA